MCESTDPPPAAADQPGSVWTCPVCGVDVPHPYGPGRKRVYCTAACKQRAYRWRRDHGVRLLATPWQPAERSGFLKGHAVRPAADFVGGRSDARGREVTVCGAFARRNDPDRWLHTEFVPGPSACHSCMALIGADPSWGVDYPPGRVAYAAGRWDWCPNPIEQRRADYFAGVTARVSARAA